MIIILANKNKENSTDFPAFLANWHVTMQDAIKQQLLCHIFLYYYN